MLWLVENEIDIQGVQKVLPTTHNSAYGDSIAISDMSSSRTWLSFISYRFRISLFSPTGEKSTLKREQVSLAAWRAPPPNLSRITRHPWKRCLLWGLGPIFGCSLRLRWYKLRGHLTSWPTSHWFGKSFAPVSRRLSFRQCADAFTTLQYFCDNGERDSCPRS
jgi:hypothetical protein